MILSFGFKKHQDLKKIILKPSSSVEDLKFLTKEYQSKSQKYDEMIEYLKDIKIKVGKIELKIDNHGQLFLKVNYEMPVQEIRFDDDNNIVENKMFKAINMLNLISFEDMRKIQVLLEEAQNENKK